jgi:hypothetical protein
MVYSFGYIYFMHMNDSLSLFQNNNVLKELCTVHDDELEHMEKVMKAYEEKEVLLKNEK